MDDLALVMANAACSFPFGPLEAVGAGSRLEDDAGALMNSPTVGLASANIPKILFETARCHLWSQSLCLDGSGVMDRRYAVHSTS